MRALGIALLALALAVSSAQASLKLQNVDRKINLNSQFARVTETIKVKNTGDKPASQVALCTTDRLASNLRYRKVVQVLATKVELKESALLADVPAGAVCWSVDLKESIAAGESTTLEATSVHTEVQTPYPAEISQGEAQLMLYNDNVYVLSPYQVSAQTTEVILPTSNLKSYTDEKPVAKSDTKLKYGKYDLIKPFTFKEMRLHYENNKAFKKVLSLVREIEVSHWGNIYVEESYELMNAGSKHKGSFSRLKYAHTYNGRTNSFNELRARLPASAHSMYYVDLIGNISSSDVRKNSAETLLDFSPRYPLMGGWKVDFKIGYSVPLKGSLFSKRSDGKRRLSMAFGTPLEDAYVEDLTVRIVLPEGASNIQAFVPYAVQQSFDTKFTYLDTTGRPVVVLQKKGVVPEHATKFEVDYSFSSTSMLREPLLLVTAFFALFAAVIVYNRLEFTISRDAKWQEAQKAEKVATVMQQLNDVMEEEDEVLESVAKLSQQVRLSGDVEHASKERQRLETALGALDAKAKELLKAVDATSTRTGDKVRELRERARALQGRYVKMLADRCDMVKKGSPDVTRWAQQTTNQLQEARTELSAAVETLFAPY